MIGSMGNGPGERQVEEGLSSLMSDVNDAVVFE
jgi:hypothetical protein